MYSNVQRYLWTDSNFKESKCPARWCSSVKRWQKIHLLLGHESELLQKANVPNYVFVVNSRERSYGKIESFSLWMIEWNELMDLNLKK